ncbi:2-polyprenyl-6-methoxyphenol hydroxylase-like FAD-dependent oxidoreductase [Streptomyces eurocidicus]|uniref:2-polyprenyl-6-methoxyphenol hydroxylase-like FAD-dependent oxidoreductase n=2 Tax=Streptomyces eurocidicus TaxID=66423 RepID=A0A7W8F4F1_STREU|nr:2-polyprenyl-6-methoxyphenol hydroxylase-like FAD-dependent oxidoreductase [Streptomyces eurocidicus]
MHGEQGGGLDMDVGYGTDGSGFEVVVAGAGPTGLTLACDLARRGVRALLVERGSRLFPGSRGKGIQPRTQEVFDDLGVIETVRAVGGPHPTMRRWENGEPRGDWDMFQRYAPTPEIPYPEVWAVPQWRTQEILHARLRRLGGDVVFGAALTGLAQWDDGVEVRLAHGPEGRELTVRAAYVVGADGGRSSVRAALGIGRSGETVDVRPAIVADVRVDGLDRDRWHVWPEPKGGGLALCPLACTDSFQLQAHFEDEDARPDISEEGVRRLIAERTHLAAHDVREVLWASHFRVEAALADSYRSGRAFLAGDAAHVHSPVGGQGLNTGVQDAYNLGWKLGLVLRHGADPALLDTYERERRPVAAEALAVGTRLHRTARLTDRIPARRRGAATRQLAMGYRGGVLAVETRRGLPGDALQAGDRAPDGPCGEGRLFDLFRGPHFTLLAFGPVELPLVASPLVVTHRVPVESGGVSRAYAARGLFLVRPDGYVGWAGDSAAGVIDYLGRLGLS